MDASTIQYIAMGLDYFSAFLLALIIGSCHLEKNKTVLLRIYLCMASFCGIALLCEGVAYSILFSGTPNADFLRMIPSTIAIGLGYGLAFSYTCYVSHLVGPKGHLCQGFLKVLLVTGIAALCGLTVGSLQGAFFFIRNGVLIPQRFFVAAFAYDIIACLAGMFLIVKYRKHLQPKDITALFTFPVLIFLSAALQYTRIRMMFGLFMMAAVSLFVIYLMIQTDRNLQAVEQEKQLVDMNVAVMLSQIQPHFLYNTLSAIRRVVKKDPEAAEEAIENFSLYLRQNLESMNRVEPIPFAQELRHVEEYLSLEKLRFGDRLRVEYDIGFEDFSLPVLTLQPIVENAVQHGILKRQEGGRVRIATRREGAAVRLTVEDDGVGLSPNTDSQEDRLHIGFQNVQARLRLQCKGTIRVESRPGEGTTVTMTLPLM